MNFKPVKSSNILEIGHDADRNELYVKYKDGSIYIHSEVSASSHKKLMSSPSHTKHLNLHVIPKSKGKKKNKA